MIYERMGYTVVRSSPVLPKRSGLTYLNYLIPGKLQVRDVGGIARHQIPVKDTKHRLVCDEQQIVLLPFQLKDDWLQPHR